MHRIMHVRWFFTLLLLGLMTTGIIHPAQAQNQYTYNLTSPGGSILFRYLIIIFAVGNNPITAVTVTPQEEQIGAFVLAPDAIGAAWDCESNLTPKTAVTVTITTAAAVKPAIVTGIWVDCNGNWYNLDGTPFNFNPPALVSGGSSAQLGNFTQSKYAPGFIPGLFQTYVGNIPGYGTTKYVVIANAMVDQDVISNPSGDDSQIQVSDDGTGHPKVAIFVRSDSGQGARYLFNGGYITSWTNVSGSSPSSPFVQVTGSFGGPYTFTTLAPGSVTLSDGTDLYGDLRVLADGSNNVPTSVPITTAFTDVAASSIISFANSVLNPPITISGKGPKFTVNADLGIGTLLTLYNVSSGGLSDVQENFTQSEFASMIAGAPGGSAATDPITWNEIAPNQPNHAVTACYHEPQSGTRITELTDIQGVGEVPGYTPKKKTPAADSFDVLIENVFGNNAGGTQGNGGTGTMLNAVNSNAFFAGYAFVTGAVGNNHPNIRVASYNGVLPYASNGGTSVGLSLPNNNGQSNYSFLGGNYYTATVNGQYELWTYFREYSLDSGTTAAAIPALISGDNSGLVHSLGITLIPEMNCARAQYTVTSSTNVKNGKPFVETNVQDGGFITFDQTGGAINSKSVLNGVLQ